jgi:hypothetical protein
MKRYFNYYAKKNKDLVAYLEDKGLKVKYIGKSKMIMAYDFEINNKIITLTREMIHYTPFDVIHWQIRSWLQN